MGDSPVRWYEEPTPDYQHFVGIELVLESEELLRKKWRGLATAEQAFRAEAAQQMEILGRKKFEPQIDLAVQLEFHVPWNRRNQPHMPGVVKAYLDALEGLAYDDDRQISLLLVHRRAGDHPLHRLGGAQSEEDRAASVFVAVLPTARYTQLYDCAYQWAAKTQSADSPFTSRWTEEKEAELRRLRAEQAVDRTDPQLAELIRLDEEQRLCDAPFTAIDRPGPAPAGSVPDRAREGAIVVPLPGQAPGTSEAWKQAVLTSLKDFAGAQAGAPFSGFVSLDIAVCGRSFQGKDLDNLAHELLVPFEDTLCVDRGTVTSYRVYQAVGDSDGVFVRAVDDPRLIGLQVALSEAHVREIEAGDDGPHQPVD